MNTKQFKATTKCVIVLLSIITFGSISSAQSIKNVVLKDGHTAIITRTDNQKMVVDFYRSNILRVFQSKDALYPLTPKANPEAKILIDDARKKVDNIQLRKTINGYTVYSKDVSFNILTNGLFSIIDNRTHKEVCKEIKPIQFFKNKVILTLNNPKEAYYYGGGVQNGRFSHRGTAINIVNENNWTDGGVASPAPFYWTTSGYGLMWYTFAPGRYDFGSDKPNETIITHNTNYLDIFLMVSSSPTSLLKDYYSLTGKPILLPKFGFYEGHLNAYNRDYWKEDPNGILFEDGKRYKESQKDNGGIKESLNGEKNNYQFSARAVIDRYNKHNMPLGWILPNDGYGAGYGQTNTLEGNIQNLKTFGDYARAHGVQIGLWTQSDLTPNKKLPALLQRDIIKEIKDAGVRILKTDVAWVGAGYSFGLNGIESVAKYMPKYGDDARPMIISLDGWAGTQHYAAVWSGDQTGGKWEYIRFHIPTYIGSGLSGEPNITSDMDGIFGGQNPIVNTRDFQWKTFTPMQLNMDGWGANPKYPFILGEPTASINRNYLKWKSELLPYTYTIAHEAINGLPIIRAIFLDDHNPYTYSKSTEYEYMYGPYFVVAPIYQDTHSDKKGNDIRNNIYLPKGKWIDYFTGNVYEGGRVINNFDAPIWKLPVFVKAGAIIPMNNANNNITQIDNTTRQFLIYPYGKSSFDVYHDDGYSVRYLNGEYATTHITSNLQPNGLLKIEVGKMVGSYRDMPRLQKTILNINISKQPRNIKVFINNKIITLKKAYNKEAYLKGENLYYYESSPNFNRFATKGSCFDSVKIIRNPILHIKLQPIDISKNSVRVLINGYHYDMSNHLLRKEGNLDVPKNALVSKSHITPYSITPSWNKVDNADYYELELNGILFSTIKEDSLLIDNLRPNTSYTLKLRAVNKSGYSKWITIKAHTKEDPLKNTVHYLSATINRPIQEGFELKNLFDGNVGTIMHTEYRKNAIPFDIVINLNAFVKLDKMSYLPRRDASNGTILSGTIYYSNDKINWIKAGNFSWVRNSDTKVFDFVNHPTARYIKLKATSAVGNYGSGREIYVFRVPGSKDILPGDINNDNKIDNNDLTSYLNYTGLKKGDPDFDGYVSRGDVNHNGLIDAYDISNVAIWLDGGVNDLNAKVVSGSINIQQKPTTYHRGDIVSVAIWGKSFNNVNALSLVIPYNNKIWQYEGMDHIAVGTMKDFTKDRLHKDGTSAVYPTFVNIGKGQYLQGDREICVLHFKALKNGNSKFSINNPILVDVNLNQVK